MQVKQNLIVALAVNSRR